MGSIKSIKNLKHILVITLVSLLLLVGGLSPVFQDFSLEANKLFIYRTGSGAWQDHIYKHQLIPSSDIAIIRIDEESINALQAQGDLKMLRISKAIYADLVEKLESVGVKGIAFDIIFQNADPDEEFFAKTLRKYDNIVIAADSTVSPSCTKDQSGSYITCAGLPRSVYAGTPLGLVDTSENFAFRTGRAALERVSGEDVNQRSLVVTETLPLKLYNITHKTPLGFGSGTDTRHVLNVYFGGDYAYRGYSLRSLLKSDDIFQRIYAKEFKDKYVFIGESGTAIHDTVISPATDASMDGVELHAHFLEGLLQNKMLSQAPDAIIFSVYIVLTCLLVIIYFFIPKYLSPIFAIMSIVAIIWISRYLYEHERVLVDILPLFLSGFFFPSIVTYVYKYFIVDREKRELQNNFGHYIDPVVVKEIAERDEPIELGGERRELTILFSDIAGFTTISEALSPQDLFYLMTSYLSTMTDVLIHEGGTLDKYIGDAVMGFFGAPIAHPDDAVRACRTALIMHERLPAFNADITTHGIPAVDFRVGIATGEVVVGNIGSHNRFNYTVLGDTVNLASRLEGAGKEYGVHIIISESVRAKIGDNIFHVRELDTLAVKGKTEGIKIFELTGFTHNIVDRIAYLNYERALALYRSGKYHEAGEIWASQMEVDPPSRVMALRCAEIIKGEVIVENGIFHMTHK